MSWFYHRRSGTGARTRGSAAVEFALCLPFILGLMAITWDVRELIASQTRMVRELDTVVLAMSNALDADPFAAGMPNLVDMLRPRTASGSVQVAVIGRGEERPTTPPTPCPTYDPLDPVSTWCPPHVYDTWPAPPPGVTTPQDPFPWSDGSGDACSDATDPDNGSWMPGQGQHFGTGERLLRCEAGGAGCPSSSSIDEDNWTSRTLDESSWWIVLDICLEPPLGTFAGKLSQLTVTLFTAQPVTRRRVVWPSLYDRADCTWCNFP